MYIFYQNFKRHYYRHLLGRKELKFSIIFPWQGEVCLVWLMRECEVVVTVCTHNIGIVSVVTSAAAAAGSPCSATQLESQSSGSGGVGQS